MAIWSQLSVSQPVCKNHLVLAQGEGAVAPGRWSFYKASSLLTFLENYRAKRLCTHGWGLVFSKL